MQSFRFIPNVIKNSVLNSAGKMHENAKNRKTLELFLQPIREGEAKNPELQNH